MKPTFRNRGATLIELTVASAVGAITLLATFSVFNATRSTQDSAEKLITSYQSLNLALLSMQRQLENVGYRFPGQPLNVRNNVSPGAQFSMGPGGGTALSVVSEGSSSPGIVAGTDVIDILTGDPNRLVGEVVGVTADGQNLNVTLDSAAPMTPAEVAAMESGNTIGPLVVFADANQACLGLVQGKVTGGNTSSRFQVRVFDFTGPHSSPPLNCPAPGMTSFGLGERRRYMIYQEANGQNIGLYTQVSLPSVNGHQNAGTLSAPLLLARGVEDLQLSPSMGNTNNVLGCGNGLLCMCGQGPGMPECGNNFLDNLSLYRGMRIRLVSKGLSPIKRKGAKRPRSFDREIASTQDDVERQVIEGFVDFPNLNPNIVTPIF